MYVKFKGIVPSQYVWKCTGLGFLIMYFLGRKFAHISASIHTHTPHTHLENVEMWDCTSFVYFYQHSHIDVSTFTISKLHTGYLFTCESNTTHNQWSILYKHLQGPVSLTASSQLVWQSPGS